MKYTKIALCFALLCLTACQATKQATPKALHGTWQVAFFRFQDGRVMSGALMGYPQYQFTAMGHRIKTLNEEPSPPPDTVVYAVRNDSIYYPERPKLPPVQIIKLTTDSLILHNEKLTWHLYKAS